MKNIAKRIKQIENELLELPTGYISKKIIDGKERFYLQWLEDGKLKSRYVNANKYDDITVRVEKCKQLQEELKSLKETPNGIRESNLKQKQN